MARVLAQQAPNKLYTNYGDVLADIDPVLFAFIGCGLAIGLSVLGAAWGIFITGSSLLGAAVKAPRIASKNLIRCAPPGAPGDRLPPPTSTAHAHAPNRAPLRSIIFCEAVAIYGVIVSIILQTKMEKPDLSKSLEDLTANHFYDMASGYALFWAGVCCGFGNLACGSAAAPPAARTSRARPPYRRN